jgi:hypothetical protein
MRLQCGGRVPVRSLIKRLQLIDPHGSGVAEKEGFGLLHIYACDIHPIDISDCRPQEKEFSGIVRRPRGIPRFQWILLEFFTRLLFRVFRDRHT